MFKLLKFVAGPDLDIISTTSNSSAPVYKAKFVSLPYLKNHDVALKNILQEVNISTGFRSGKKLSSFFISHKSRVDWSKTGGSIYKLNCKSCPLAYVGETGRPLGVRIGEHRRAVRIQDKAYATVGHATEFGHVIDTDHPTVLDRVGEWNKRLWLEAAPIQRFGVFNANIGKRTISDAWNSQLLPYTRFTEGH